MGAGLRKVAKLHGGLIVKDRNGNVAKYDTDGKLKSYTTKDGKTVINKPTENK